MKPQMKLKSVLVFLIIAWTSVFYPISNAKSVDRVKTNLYSVAALGNTFNHTAERYAVSRKIQPLI